MVTDRKTFWSFFAAFFDFFFVVSGAFVSAAGRADRNELDDFAAVFRDYVMVFDHLLSIDTI